MQIYKAIMKIFNYDFEDVFNLFLIAIASSFFFRVPSTWLLILFVLFCAFNFKKLEISKFKWILIGCISSPFLLEIVFFLNNDSLKLGIKAAEKTVSLLLLPIIILGNANKLNLKTLLKGYSVITTSVILLLFIRFLIISPKIFSVYLKGNELWEVGYVFAESFKMHAPALNLHLGFLTIVCFKLLSDFLKLKQYLWVCLYSIFLILNFFFVLFVNTKLAILMTIAGVVLVFFFDIFRKYKPKKIAVISLITIVSFSSVFFTVLNNNPYIKEKFLRVPFRHIDKVGRLDEIDNPEATVYSSLVTRVSIWKSASEVALENLPLGVGSSNGKAVLIKHYGETNQRFLERSKFPAHNQFLDFTIKFGILGFLVVALYIFTLGYIGIKLRSSIATSLFILFLSVNLVDDFLIRFDGIVFSGFWFSIFAALYSLERSRKSIQNQEKVIL